MKFNEVTIPEDTDFSCFKRLCDETSSDWELAYSKKTLRVWTKSTPESNFKMIKARTEFGDIRPAVVYDVLHDPVYRVQWDKYMLEGKDIGVVMVNSDLCYYAAKSPKPFRNRDFVMQRMWLETPTEMIVLNHSICHDDFPPRKGFVRALSHLTGYMIRPLGNHGCQLTYVSHSDPKGRLPSWVINRLTHIVAPAMIKKLHKACSAYPEWKKKYSPDFKPWLFPEQQNTEQRVDLNKCKPRDYKQSEDALDESMIDSAAGDASDDESIQNGSS